MRPVSQSALCAVVLAGLCLPALAVAQPQELENTTSMAAVQERTYRMQHEIDFSGGVLPLDPFSKGLFAGGGYTLHFSDAFAWQVRGAYSFTLRSDLRLQLERDFGVLPNAFEEIRAFVGSDALWKPFYGKLSVLNRWMLHGELFLLAGATVFWFPWDPGLGLRPAVNVGGGVRVFVTRWFGVRVDLSDNVVLPLGGKAKGLGNVVAFTVSAAFNLGATE